MNVPLVPAAGTLVDGLALLLIGTTLWMINVRRLRELILLLALQALLLAAVALTVAVSTGNGQIYVAAGLTLVLKVGVIPAYLFWILRRVRLEQAGPQIRTRRGWILVGLVLVLGAYWQVGFIHVPVAVHSGDALPAAFSLVLLGMLLMVIRQKALTQVVALMTMENGLYLLAMSTTYGMPLVVELGVFFDILVAALLLGVFAFRINRTFDTINVSTLRNLRG